MKVFARSLLTILLLITIVHSTSANGEIGQSSAGYIFSEYGSERLKQTPLTEIKMVRFEEKDTLCLTPDMLSGVYRVYPEERAMEIKVTDPPKGYKPFYVSHYGRHGSRYLISDRDYERVHDILSKASEDDVLTPLGKNVLDRLDNVMVETRGRGGDLTPLGVRQHRGIAERLFKHYPEIFQGEKEISARSTVVIRCILSMDAFCERLKELNPHLQMTRESSGRYMDYLNYHSPESNAFTGGDWKIYYKKFEKSRVKSDDFVKRLISDSSYIERYIDPDVLMWSLYWLAADSRNIETPNNFDDLFTPEEYFGLWESGNYHNYVVDSSSPENGGLVVGNAKNLLRNIIETADEAIRSGNTAATLRFGHDGNLQPLAAILEMKGSCPTEQDADNVAYRYHNFHVTPMAGNIQLIFFRNNVGNIIVKFLLNEEETAIPIRTDKFPFYEWKDVRSYYQTKLEK